MPANPAPSTTNFLVVANRLPVDRSVDDDGNVSWRTSPGGLVTALEPVMRKQGGAWVGWHGAADEVVEPFDHDGFTIVPVPLSEDEVEEYYEGFSNATLWPLYHDAVAFPEFHREWWDSYKTVNRRFAERAAAVADEGATVWVQDYQLQLVPQMLREMRPDLKIGFFLHIPFPPVELFLQLPWRREILEGLLGADLVGFQTVGGSRNFLQLVKTHTSLRVNRDSVEMPDGRSSVSRAFPISIDTQGFRELANTEAVKKMAEELLDDLGHPEVIYLGVDRLDYTKGLRQKVRAFGELFESGQLDPDKAVFIQVATPSRERVEEYIRLRHDIDQLVGSINSHTGSLGRAPIVYRHSSYGRDMLAAMYRIADVMVVTPLRDGMNLVAKEYIACHADDDGALVLSEFAGAARELKQAYMVNPYDLNALKDTLVKAGYDNTAEKKRRLRALRKQVAGHTIDDWASSFLTALTSPRRPDDLV